MLWPIRCQSGVTEKLQELWTAGPAAVVTTCVFRSSHLLVLFVPNTLGFPVQTCTTRYFIFCQVIQNLYILPIFEAGDPSSKLGPWRNKETDRGGLGRTAGL